MQSRKPMHGNGRREFLQVLGAGALGLTVGSAATSKPMRGVFPIGQTPFTEDDKLDLDCLAAEVRFCNRGGVHGFASVSYTHLRAHETDSYLVCRLLLEKKK